MGWLKNNNQNPNLLSTLHVYDVSFIARTAIFHKSTKESKGGEETFPHSINYPTII